MDQKNTEPTAFDKDDDDEAQEGHVIAFTTQVGDDEGTESYDGDEGDDE